MIGNNHSLQQVSLLGLLRAPHQQRRRPSRGTARRRSSPGTHRAGKALLCQVGLCGPFHFDAVPWAARGFVGIFSLAAHRGPRRMKLVARRRARDNPRLARSHELGDETGDWMRRKITEAGTDSVPASVVSATRRPAASTSVHELLELGDEIFIVLMRTPGDTEVGDTTATKGFMHQLILRSLDQLPPYSTEPPARAVRSRAPSSRSTGSQTSTAMDAPNCSAQEAAVAIDYGQFE